MTEARSDSLYERLRKRGLLDLVIRQLYDGEKTPKAMVQFLRGEGVATSQSSLYNMIKLHGLAYRLESAEEATRALGLEGGAEANTDAVLRKKLVAATFEADGLKELQILAQIRGDSEKLAQAERKVQLAEAKERRAVYDTQQAGAAEMETILADAEALRAMQEERANLIKSKASDSERIEAIRKRLYGDNAVFLTAAERGAA